MNAQLLVLGGARSGKSRFAQACAEAASARSGRDLVFLATAQAFDAEMKQRIAAHVADRRASWRTVEAPFDLVAALAAEATSSRIVLVDCLTLWLSNLMLRGDDLEVAGRSLAEQARASPGSVVYVSNEVGAGIVPDNALARRFRDAQGRLNQLMAAACRDVVLVTAGLPLVLKPCAPPQIEL